MGGFQNIWDQNLDKKRDIGLIWDLEQRYRTKYETKKSYRIDLGTGAKLQDQI